MTTLSRTLFVSTLLLAVSSTEARNLRRRYVEVQAEISPDIRAARRLDAAFGSQQAVTAANSASFGSQEAVTPQNAAAPPQDAAPATRSQGLGPANNAAFGSQEEAAPNESNNNNSNLNGQQEFGSAQEIPNIQLTEAARAGPLGDLMAEIEANEAATNQQAPATSRAGGLQLGNNNGNEGFGDQQEITAEQPQQGGDGFGNATPVAPNGAASGPATSSRAGSLNLNAPAANPTSGGFGNQQDITAQQQQPAGSNAAPPQDNTNNNFGDAQAVAPTNNAPSTSRAGGFNLNAPAANANPNSGFGNQEEITAAQQQSGSTANSNAPPPQDNNNYDNFGDAQAVETHGTGSTSSRAGGFNLNPPAADPTSGFGSQEAITAQQQSGSNAAPPQDNTNSFGDAQAVETNGSGSTSRVGGLNLNAPAAEPQEVFGSSNAISGQSEESGSEFGDAAPVEAGSSNVRAAPSALTTSTSGEQQMGRAAPPASGGAQSAPAQGQTSPTRLGGSLQTRANAKSQQCEMKVKFFPGHEKAPSAEDIQGLMQNVKKFFDDIYSDDAETSESFIEFKATEIEHTYGPSFGEDVEFFRIDFDSNIYLKVGSNIGMSVIHRVIDTRSFEDFITDYIWTSPPYETNQFYQTRSCKLKCYDGEKEGSR